MIRAVIFILPLALLAAGCERVNGEWRNEDVETLVAASSVEAPRKLVNPYLFQEPIAPHIAAAKAGVVITSERITRCRWQLAELAQSVIIEGAGGIITTWEGGRPHAGGRVIAAGDKRVHVQAMKLING